MESRWGNCRSCRSQGNERKIFISLNAPFTILRAVYLCGVNRYPQVYTQRRRVARRQRRLVAVAQCNLNLWGRAGMRALGQYLESPASQGRRASWYRNGESAPILRLQRYFPFCRALKSLPGAVNDFITELNRTTQIHKARRDNSFDQTCVK